MLQLMLQTGTAIEVNPKKRPGSIFVRSDTADVARVEDRTYICSTSQDDAGPTNNWEDPAKMRAKLTEALHRIHARPDHVCDSLLDGTDWFSISKVGVEISDSPYVVANMHIMARVGVKVLRCSRHGR